jgi:hypothetical protein
MSMRPNEHWVKVSIPVASVTELGFHPHIPKYEVEVLNYFPPSAKVRWFGIGGSPWTDPSGKLIDTIVWDFGVGNLGDAIAAFKAMFRERAFPVGTTVTKVIKHPDCSFSFETLLRCPVEG